MEAVQSSWAHLEAKSAQSGPQEIPPELRGKVFSWEEVKKNIGTLLPCIRKNIYIYSYPASQSPVSVTYLDSTSGPKMDTGGIPKTEADTMHRGQPPRSFPPQTRGPRGLQSLVQGYH